MLPHITLAIKHTIELAKSEVNLRYYQLLRWVLAAFVVIPTALLICVFGVYGLILLDRAADLALSPASNPPWLSPLVRGGAYVFMMSLLFAPVLWHVLRPAKAAK